MEEKNINYPRFIPHKPCGIDKFEGKSQERLTNAIANHIVSNDNNSQNLSRIIGLEGGWGVGKSNIIKQLKKHDEIKDKYYLFEYDAWGNQEDLQRRSFLELLTDNLINEGILLGNTEIKIKGAGTQTVTWQEKLRYLLARKTETKTEKYPRISNSMIATFLATVLTPLFMFFGFLAKIFVKLEWLSICLSFIIPLIPILTVIIVWLIAKKKNNKYGKIDYLLAIYNDKIENDICYETISEEEPTVIEFKKWMQSISEHLSKNKKIKKLIVVYDNMDRLPAEKVKELWSSIHTFFSEDGFDNVWAIIPFDEKHLSCAFGGSDDEETKVLTKYFISKTFPVVYRVTSPVITDFKNIFDTLFKEAFANTETKQQEDINRIFRLEKPNATVREMIEFINQLVALKIIWEKEIDILYISIFVLKKDDILLNSAERILSGDYLSEYILEIIPYNEILQKTISALVYGVSLDIAEQIPMLKYIDRCFRREENTDINKYSNSENFIHILSDRVKNTDIAQIDNIIQCLVKLDISNLSRNDQKTIHFLWNTLAERKMKVSLSKQEFGDNYKLLLKNLDDSHKQSIIKHLCKEIQLFEKFISENYYNTLKDMDDFIKSNDIDIKIADNLTDLEKEPEVFVKYVLCTKENYPIYKLTTKPEALSEYLSYSIIENPSVLEVLKYLINDKNYQFNEVKIKIEETIQNENLIKESNFKPLFDAYKILSGEKPLEVQLNQTQRQNIWNVLASKPNTLEYLEIVAIQIANGTNIGGTFNESQVKNIAEQMDYYAIYGNLLINNLSWNIPILSQVLKYMTENKLGHKLSLEKILQMFFDIKNNLNVTEQVLLKQLNRWDGKQLITSNNIQQVIPNAQFFQFSTAIKNNKLTDYLNTTIIQALANITIDTLYQQRQQPNYYWNVVIKNFIDTDFLKSLQDNLTELGKRYLDDIAASRLAIPNTNDIVYKLIEKLNRKKTKETITNIRNQICNNVPGYNIDINKFSFLHKWFEKQGDLLSRAGDVCQYILSPIANDDNCLKVIIENADFYVNIINSAETQASTFKSCIKNRLLNSTDTSLISFAKRIGIEKEK